MEPKNIAMMDARTHAYPSTVTQEQLRSMREREREEERERENESGLSHISLIDERGNETTNMIQLLTCERQHRTRERLSGFASDLISNPTSSKCGLDVDHAGYGDTHAASRVAAL